MKIFDTHYLDGLTSLAKFSPRLRQHRNVPKVTKRQTSVCSTPLSQAATFVLIGTPLTRGKSY